MELLSVAAEGGNITFTYEVDDTCPNEKRLKGRKSQKTTARGKIRLVEET
jgi:hypothetical protein